MATTSTTSWVQAKKARTEEGNTSPLTAPGRPRSASRPSRVIISHERRTKGSPTSSGVRSLRSPEGNRRERRDTAPATPSPSSTSSSSSSSSFTVGVAMPVPVGRRRHETPLRESSRSVLHIQQAAELLFASPPPLRATLTSSSSSSSTALPFSPSSSSSPTFTSPLLLHRRGSTGQGYVSPSLSSSSGGIWNQFWDLVDDVEADKMRSHQAKMPPKPQQQKRQRRQRPRGVESEWSLDDLQSEEEEDDELEDVTQGVGELVQRLNSGLLDEALRERLGISRSYSSGSEDMDQRSLSSSSGVLKLAQCPSGTMQLQKLQERFMRYREEAMLEDQQRNEEMEQLQTFAASPATSVGSFGSYIGRCLAASADSVIVSPSSTRRGSIVNRTIGLSGEFTVGSGCFEDNEFFRHLLRSAASPPPASPSATPPLLFSL